MKLVWVNRDIHKTVFMPTRLFSRNITLRNNDTKVTFNESSATLNSEKNYQVTEDKVQTFKTAAKKNFVKKEPQNSRTLLVNKLALNLKDEDLKKVFQSFGTIEKFSISIDTGTNRSKGHGEIVFSTALSAKRAFQQMQGYVMNDFPIRLLLKSDRKNHQRIQYDVLCIKNLPYDITESDIMSVFVRHQALRCGLIKAPVTHRSLGYGFVRFSSAEAAEKALNELKDLKIKGRKIKLSCAEPKQHNYEYIV